MILAKTHQEDYQYEGIQIAEIANWYWISSGVKTRDMAMSGIATDL